MTVTLHTPEEAARWLRARVRGVLHTDSRKVGAGDGFIAWPGAAHDARAYVRAALQQGAAACLVEHAGVDAYAYAADEARIATYAGLKAASGPIAAAYYEEPSRQLDVLAVTGTNGKTSTSWWLAQALARLRPPRPCGLIGTLGVGRVPPDGAATVLQGTGLTTPDPVLLQQTLRRFVDEGLVACAMEASSIGMAERRLDGTQIRVALFTNFTQDHLDYHGSMQAYWQAKAALFDWPGLQAAVVNVDDAKGAELAQRLETGRLDLWTVSLRPTSDARLTARAIRLGQDGVDFEVCESGHCVSVQTHTLGTYNVSNLLVVMAALRSLGVALTEAAAACARLQPVPGRMAMQGGNGQPLAVVDYAHTPDALAQALRALRPVAERRGGMLWCVFGCGGDRDTLKRPLMGAEAASLADRVVLTSDNPRHEDPAAIVAQIRAGMPAAATVEVELDRARAIAWALKCARPADVVLVAGKGHEDYQETAGLRVPFSDEQQVRRALQARAEGVGA